MSTAPRSGSLEIRGLTKSYDGRTVLEDVSLTIERGRVHALVGENGAGKSTLIKIACGLVGADTGEVSVDGRVFPTGVAREASAHGIGVVHQHFMLVEPMSVSDNVVLGHEPRRGPFQWFVDRSEARSRVRRLSEKHGMHVDPDARIETLGVGERQRVELLKVLHRGAEFVLLDEPTAVLSPREIQSLLGTMRALAATGTGVLFVSHKLAEVLAVADEITVLRRGRRVLHSAVADTNADALARAVVGADPPAPAPARSTAIGDDCRLELRRVCARGLRDFDLTLRAGETVGVAGVEGNGQRDLAEVIAGLTSCESGTLVLDGKDVSRWSVLQRRDAGIGFVPEDRETGGLLADLSIAENLALGDPATAGRLRLLSPARIRDRASIAIEKFGVRPPDPWAIVRTLSGGNAQKVLLARELARTLRVLVVAQPTRGVDISASAEIHTALREARDRGVAALLISSDLDELRALCDRVIVLRSGQIAGSLAASDADDERLGPLMVGGA